MDLSLSLHFFISIAISRACELKLKREKSKVEPSQMPARQVFVAISLSFFSGSEAEKFG